MQELQQSAVSQEAAESALHNIDTSNMDDETAAAVEAAIDGALGSIQAVRRQCI